LRVVKIDHIRKIESDILYSTLQFESHKRVTRTRILLFDGPQQGQNL